MNRIHHMSLQKMFIALIVAGMAFTGCSKGYLDINDDPNRPTEEDDIAPQLILPATLHATGQRQASNNFTFLGNWMGYWAPSGSYAIVQDETSYNIDFNFGDVLWQNHYNVLFDLEQTIRRAKPINDSVIAGAAMVLSAKLTQEVVDIYGNVPYSQAFKGNENTHPGYDNAADIYKALMLRLDTAISYLSGTPFETFEAADIANHGDTDKWIKFANTLKLRLLIRQSEVSGFNPAAEIAKINANGKGFLMAGETVSVNPGYSNAVDKQSPFYANYGVTPFGALANPITKANQFMVKILRDSHDPRLSRFYRPTGSGNVVGNTYGLLTGNPLGSAASRPGAGVAGSPTQDQWILTSVESLFLQAEAIARGWITGSAQQAYEAAVTESFTWLGVPNATAAANTYLTTEPIAQWSNAGGTPQARAKFIAYQKYIALNSIDIPEAWSDQRRLDMIPSKGYISVNPARLRDEIPSRLLYPQSEYTNNAESVNAQGTINQFTSKIFWDVN